MKASPFKIADVDTLIYTIIEQNNFTNESLHVIGQQLDRIEEKIDEKTVVSKSKKPLIDLPSQREKVKFKTSQAKTLEIVEKMLSDLKVKLRVLLQVLLELFQKMRRKLFLKKIQILTHYLLFLLKRFLMMIYQKLKDLLENPIPYLLQKIGNLLLLICSLKNDLFKPNFLFLLIKFMNGILMVCLNRKSLIKWVICVWLELLI